MRKRKRGIGNLHRLEFEKDGQAIEMSVHGSPNSNNQEVVMQAALQGLCIVYTYHDRIYGWIKEGRLKRVIADWSAGFADLFF